MVPLPELIFPVISSNVAKNAIYTAQALSHFFPVGFESVITFIINKTTRRWFWQCYECESESLTNFFFIITGDISNDRPSNLQRS